MYKVAVYITAYEEKEALENTIAAIRQQSYPVEEIFIVDNSPQQIVQTDLYQNTLVEFHPENLGVAGGLLQGICWARETGYDFLWLFDQDSQPAADALEKLINQYQKLSHQGEKIGIIAPTILDINIQQEFPGCVFQEYKLIPGAHAQFNDYYKCDAVITSGSLVNMAAAKDVEFPTVDLFLDAVDYAYCLNFRKQGYEIIVIKDTIMLHRIGKYSQVVDRLAKDKKEVKTYLCPPSRYYYACRNHTFLETRNSNKRKLLSSIVYRIKSLIHMLTRIIRYEPDLVWLKLYACILGTLDGFCGKLGKIQ